MLSKTLLTAYLAILVEARFGQEQVPIQAISEVQGGQPGQAQTIAGAAISDLLAAANPCDKLQRGDQILAELGTGADAMAAAIGMVAAEQNFNPFNTDKPTICSDPTLPTSAALRGITPLVDPDVDGADVANALSNQTRANPLDATGLSVADLLQQNGFTNFATKDSNGNAGAAGDANAANSNANANAGSASASGTAAAATAAADVSSSSTSCNTNADQQQQQQQSSNSNSNSSSASNANSNSSTAAAAAASSSAGNGQTASSKNLDFGKCTPTMKFVGGLNGRPADEFTFQAIDPLVAKGQQEALNPNIITNRICDQLTNVCDAADDAKAACLDAKAQIEALGTRDQSTADAWNEALGFAGAASARKMMVRSMRRGVRGGVRREVMDWTKVRA
ncbi:uncharacterized protein LTHEOB_5822 [Lasiodiplodia theobromae]|uniref:Circumsporozoite protein n=1 Tax=Lasiodiplodia theobromae TaxID=45133 RepID=A0A5N5DKS0_9PEZI|nr:uncharacterized protein LTHEOB_5822 [Lasiodiplodia theobromae]KAB2578347.1 hypothetical protein DBV05_g3008 [Lasiodiplodia theobromae]KAF4544813.1 hypothetical protein LTHEOB_5822 [Lasiodiplodia theobromae]